MKLSELKGKSIKQISEILQSKGHLMYLAGDKQEESVLQITKQHGSVAGAVLCSAWMYFEEYGGRNSIWEAAKLWKEASRLSQKKENAETVWHGANNIEEFMAYGGFDKIKRTWMVKGINKLSPDNLFSLGNFLIAISIMQDDIKGQSNSEAIGYMMAGRVLSETNEALQKEKSNVGKRS